MKWKFNLFLLLMAILLVGSTIWFGWQHYQVGVRDGSKIQIEEEVLTATAPDESIRLAPGEEGIYLSDKVGVPIPFSITFTGDDEDWIELEIVSENYETDQLFLLKVSVGKEQVGIVYFDENEHIRFDGDKEKFERALLKILRARVDFWKAAEEGWEK